MRAICNSLLAILALAALLWGNCFSCPQLLFNFSAHAPSHGCCKHPGSRPVSSGAECPSLALKHFVKTDPGPQAQPQVAGSYREAAAEMTLYAPAAGADPLLRFCTPRPICKS